MGNNHSSTGVIPSLIKWTGSKRSQALQIAAIAPRHYNKYYEPFIGSGAMMYLLGRPGSVGGDIYKPLIMLWRLIRDDPTYLIFNYKKQWNLLQDDSPDYYYTVRSRFNQANKPEDLNFLLRTCVNGIARFNKSGKFNTSFHLSRDGMHPKNFRAIVKAWTPKIQDIKFVVKDYEETISSAKRTDFIYFDPPYAGNKQRYIADLDFDRFCRVLDKLNSKQIKWALSFDGIRGNVNYNISMPKDLYRKKMLINSGHSAVSKVLNGSIESVSEALYLNYKP